MAKVCYFTGRKTVSANNRSHAMNKTKRVAKPNLQKVTVLIDGKPKKVWASARALKSGNVKSLRAFFVGLFIFLLCLTLIFSF